MRQLRETQMVSVERVQNYVTNVKQAQQIGWVRRK
jgi:hypothetical protein